MLKCLNMNLNLLPLSCLNRFCELFRCYEPYKIRYGFLEWHKLEMLCRGLLDCHNIKENKVVGTSVVIADRSNLFIAGFSRWKLNHCYR